MSGTRVVGQGISWGARVGIFTVEGKVLARWEGLVDKGTLLFLSSHGIAVDSRGDIYIGEVAMTGYGFDRGHRAMRKFARV